MSDEQTIMRLEAKLAGVEAELKAYEKAARQWCREAEKYREVLQAGKDFRFDPVNRGFVDMQEGEYIPAGAITYARMKVHGQ